MDEVLVLKKVIGYQKQYNIQQYELKLEDIFIMSKF